MTTIYRCQVVGQPLAADAARDYMTNVLWYSLDTTPPSNLGDALNAAFAGSAGPYFAFNSVDVRVYNHANPLHSPPVYIKHHGGSGSAAYGPRQVAICLSFYSGLNIKGKRGRIYVGPWNSAMMSEYVPAGAGSIMSTLMGNLKFPGGPDAQQLIHHVASDTFSPVDHWFWNNRWDTMRSRLPKETARAVFS